jgi:hypothetical protein
VVVVVVVVVVRAQVREGREEHHAHGRRLRGRQAIEDGDATCAHSKMLLLLLRLLLRWRRRRRRRPGNGCCAPIDKAGVGRDGGKQLAVQAQHAQQVRRREHRPSDAAAQQHGLEQRH